MTNLSSWHTDECVSKFNEREAEIERWNRRWPRACADCRGYGQLCSTYDPSPQGISLSPGTMTDCDPCATCTERDLCARCASPLSTRRRRLARWWTDFIENKFYEWPPYADAHPARHWIYRRIGLRYNRIVYFNVWARLRIVSASEVGVGPCPSCGWNYDDAEPPQRDCEGCSENYLREYENMVDWRTTAC